MSRAPLGGLRVLAAPRLGEHTDEIVRDLLHYGDEHIDAVRASGALGAPRAGEP